MTPSKTAHHQNLRSSRHEQRKCTGDTWSRESGQARCKRSGCLHAPSSPCYAVCRKSRMTSTRCRLFECKDKSKRRARYRVRLSDTSTPATDVGACRGDFDGRLGSHRTFPSSILPGPLCSSVSQLNCVPAKPEPAPANIQTLTSRPQSRLSPQVIDLASTPTDSSSPSSQLERRRLPRPRLSLSSTLILR